MGSDIDTKANVIIGVCNQGVIGLMSRRLVARVEGTENVFILTKRGHDVLGSIFGGGCVDASSLPDGPGTTFVPCEQEQEPTK